MTALRERVFRVLGAALGVLALTVGIAMLLSGVRGEISGIMAPLSIVALGAYFLWYAFTGLSIARWRMSRQRDTEQ